MSTIGHPLSDIANLLQPFTLVTISPAAAKDLLVPFQSISEVPGLPPIAECLFWYRNVAGWNPVPEMIWANAFSLFRMSVVRQGITARYAARQASGSTAIEIGRGMFTCSRLTLSLIRMIKEAQAEPRVRL